MRILVAGASGYIGQQLIPKLMTQGHQVYCMMRRPEDATKLPAGSIPRFSDVLRPESLPEAMCGAECAYYLIHSMAGGEKGFEERDRTGARNFAIAAREAGMRRIIYLGGLGSGEVSPHLASRQETGRILRKFGPPVIELRAGIIVGSGSASFEIIRALGERLPFMICPRWVATRVQPIFIGDVLRYLTACALADASLDGEIVEIGGASIETYERMIREYAQVRGLRRCLLRVPVLTPRLSSYWMDLVTPVPSSITRPLVEGLRTEVVCRDSRALELFPEIVPLSYRDALECVVTSSAPAGCDDPDMAAGCCTRSGMTSYCAQVEIDASPSIVRDYLHTLGGGRGWLHANFLWQLRGGIDKLLGGTGMRRSRVRFIPLRAGDSLDFWRVYEANDSRLLLQAEMKLPGKAWLQFRVFPMDKSTTCLRMIASFEPLGLVGRAYWWALYPVHVVLFRGLLRRIKDEVEKVAPADRPGSYGKRQLA